jgi:hypothetical protein
MGQYLGEVIEAANYEPKDSEYVVVDKTKRTPPAAIVASPAYVPITLPNDLGQSAPDAQHCPPAEKK